MKGAEIFPQKQFKNKKLGQFSLEFRQNILFITINLSPSGEIHLNKTIIATY
jgi:hypothetical protein